MEEIKATPRWTETLTLGEERELVRRCQRGDLTAFDRLIEAFQDTMYGVAYRLMGDYDDANDLAQEVFLACYRKIGQYRGESRLKTWLYRIAANLAKNTWKRQERRGYAVTDSLDDPPPGRDEDDSPREIADEAPGPRQRAAGREAAQALWRNLKRLKPEHREALVLRCMEDLSYEEIAEVTECNLGTVKSRINRARAELRALMQDYL
ncbi:MAG: sigma-70 family RNA polymerase sigma factor [Candidatus Sumerlaeota bacterium]|nr:sigma-70 family RNA polymerase sigma factor [Candidatus Sumerlaeota bacterium]